MCRIIRRITRCTARALGGLAALAGAGALYQTIASELADLKAIDRPDDQPAEQHHRFKHDNPAAHPAQATSTTGGHSFSRGSSWERWQVTTRS